MEKTVGAFEIRRSLGKAPQDITALSDNYIVERHGEAVAAVVPIEVPPLRLRIHLPREWRACHMH